MMLIFGAIFLSLALAQDTFLIGDIISDRPNRYLKFVSHNFNEKPGPLTLKKDARLLKEKDGIVQYDLTSRGWDGQKLSAVRVKLEIPNAVPGKLYKDIVVDDIFWEDRHWAEIVGSKSGVQEFVVMDGGLLFQYNKTAPEFTATFSEVVLPDGCRCGVFAEKYNESVPNYLHYANYWFEDEQPKECANVACGWSIVASRYEDRPIKFSFKGNIEPEDTVYMRSAKGINLLPITPQLQSFNITVPGKIDLFFKSGPNPKGNRKLAINYEFENTYYY